MAFPHVKKKAKTSRRSRAVPKSKSHQGFTPEEVAALERQALQWKKGEASWLNMTSPPEDEDRWSSVEEHLLAKPSEHGHSLRRWKYFSK